MGPLLTSDLTSSSSSALSWAGNTFSHMSLCMSLHVSTCHYKLQIFLKDSFQASGEFQHTCFFSKERQGKVPS